LTIVIIIDINSKLRITPSLNDFAQEFPMPTECQTLKIEEAAKILGISRNTAYEAVKSGQVPIVKIGRRLLVPRAALERMLETAAPITAQR
jgi:excisionase family DNA binding protein